MAEVYRARWNNELDLRSLKSTMQMAELRFKTPEAVRKEVWAHVLAYKCGNCHFGTAERTDRSGQSGGPNESAGAGRGDVARVVHRHEAEFRTHDPRSITMTPHPLPGPLSSATRSSVPAQSITDVLTALVGKLAEAGHAAAEARAALARGEATAAIGVLLPTEQVLRDALALHIAAVVLHLEPC